MRKVESWASDGGRMGACLNAMIAATVLRATTPKTLTGTAPMAIETDSSAKTMTHAAMVAQQLIPPSLGQSEAPNPPGPETATLSLTWLGVLPAVWWFASPVC